MALSYRRSTPLTPAPGTGRAPLAAVTSFDGKRQATPTPPRPAAAPGRAPLTPAGFGAPPGRSARAAVQEDEEEYEQPQQYYEEENEEAAPAPPKRPPSLRQHLETYFSNENLQTDRHLWDIINDSPDGWVDIEVIMGLKQVRALRPRQSDVINALRGSWLETWSEEDSAAVRRPPSRGPLPALRQAGRKAGTSDSKLFMPPSESKVEPPPMKRPAPKATREDVGNGRGDASPTGGATNEERGGAVTRDITRAPGRRGGDEDEASQSKRMRIGTRESAAGEGDDGSALKAIGGRMHGVVQNFNMRLGLGKIRCADSGTDVVVAVADLAGFDVGDKVSFVLVKDPVLGTPKAQRLKLDGAESDGESEDDAGPAEEEAERQEEEEMPQRVEPPARVMAQPKPKARAAVGAPAPQPASATLGPASDTLPRGVRLHGNVKGVNRRMGIGGITCLDDGSVVKVPVSELAGFEVGDCVSFVISEEGSAMEIEAA